MPSNQELLRKADMAIADLASNGGTLLPEQGNSFIRKLIKEPTILRQARVVEMLSPSRKINKIGFGTRILRAAQSSVALTQAQRAKATTSQIELNTKEVIAEVRLPYDVLEDNIERATSATNDPVNAASRGGLQDTLLSMIAERTATDLEELALLSSTSYTSADADDQAYMTLFDGYLKNAAGPGGHIYDHAGAGVTKELFRNIKMQLPIPYLRNLPLMRYFTSVNAETMWRDSLANRGTALGDATLTGSSPVPAYGVPVEAVHMMPDPKVLLTNPQNLIFGIQRKVSMEFDKNISERVYIMVVTCRVAVQIEELDATAYGYGVEVNG
ncbi:hypothetical protein [Roseococcus pinisoli]|uniref:Phage major capsid protein n=1 Tax=Roseococcus pinisoli TaxID=2835040 RepID=A0ABS5QF90_9PROT|nr:hypothetical protein [Roseococcus pinisoli]MBS7812356.1 hypothetical protein [Roseococcus pinisoli]